MGTLNFSYVRGTNNNVELKHNILRSKTKYSFKKKKTSKRSTQKNEKKQLQKTDSHLLGKALTGDSEYAFHIYIEY